VSRDGGEVKVRVRVEERQPEPIKVKAQVEERESEPIKVFVRPDIRANCRRLRTDVERLYGALTDSDVAELEELATWLKGVIAERRRT